MTEDMSEEMTENKNMVRDMKSWRMLNSFENNDEAARFLREIENSGNYVKKQVNDGKLVSVTLFSINSALSFLTDGS